MKALVVDDSLVMRKVLTGALGRANIIDVAQAKDGEEAVATCESVDYDLVLMDYNLPNLSGIEALEAIRASGKSMPIIMVTTEAGKARIVEAIKAGAQNYIVKPFEPETVIDKIKTTLRHASRTIIVNH
jgi:two-component system chemotaxis response regulator CheY